MQTIDSGKFIFQIKFIHYLISMCGLFVSSLLKLFPHSHPQPILHFSTPPPLPRQPSANTEVSRSENTPLTSELENYRKDKAHNTEDGKEPADSIKAGDDQHDQSKQEKGTKLNEGKGKAKQHNNAKKKKSLANSVQNVNSLGNTSKQTTPLSLAEFKNSSYEEDHKENIQIESNKSRGSKGTNNKIFNSNGLSEEICSEVSKCNDFMFKIAPVCQSVKDHIKNAAVQIFNSKNICARIYGSMTTSLALPESDLDIVLSGLQVFDRAEIVEAIKKLDNGLSKQSYVASCRSITTAKIPVVKLSVNLERLNRGEVLRKLKVDIIIQSREDKTAAPHPVMSAWWIGWHVREVPHFQPVTLILKRLVKAKGLDRPFAGDPSSYIISLMVSAFLNTEEKYASVAECFEELVRYYGREFDSTKMMIVRGEYIALMPIEILEGRLVATDPFKPWLNAAYSVSRFKALQECLRDTLELIRKGRNLKELLNKSINATH
eukprot:TRINITY_DN14667_c0_g1_i8.p1 TRINITY_DN14667_c0_g1~~TRINITY_DN14667_c0_g1_i8.p1  ORF type:complete len:490 (+),score=99.55 TRINITY_DN14667_c0_g1_i8:126-1595(+)